MKCDVIRDLLPLYIEKLCSGATKDVVDEHVAGCADCRALLDTLRRQDKTSSEVQTRTKKINPFKKIKTMHRIVTISSIIVTMVIISALYVQLFLIGSTASTSEVTVNHVEMLDEMTFTLNLSSNINHKKIDVVGAKEAGDTYFMTTGGNVYVQANLVFALPLRTNSDYEMTFGFDQGGLGHDHIQAIYLIGKDEDDIQLIWEAK